MKLNQSDTDRNKVVLPGSFAPYVSPETGLPLELRGNRLVSSAGETFPVVQNIPRFVSSRNYAEGFGLQWNKYAKTQLDSFTGTTLSRDRLERCLGSRVEELKGARVLEAGCGAGRFTEVLLHAGAVVHSVDLSLAVEANYRNHRHFPNYRVAQADILKLPFPGEVFDVVFCLGVLQHLPSPEAGMQSLWRYVKPGGMLVIDHYRRDETPPRWNVARFTDLRTLYRRVLVALPPRLAMRCTGLLVRLVFQLKWALTWSPVMSKIVDRLFPIAFYFWLFPQLSRRLQFEWSLLDTFDGFADQYKHLRTDKEIGQILNDIGAIDRQVWVGGNGIEARCRKKCMVLSKI